MARRDTASSTSRHGYDTARRPCDTAGLRARQEAACARMAWPLGVSRDTNFVSWLGTTFCVAIRHSKAAIQRSKTAIQRSSALRHDLGMLRHARHELYRDTNFVSR